MDPSVKHMEIVFLAMRFIVTSYDVRNPRFAKLRFE